jgi:hypothetical protein
MKTNFALCEVQERHIEIDFPLDHVLVIEITYAYTRYKEKLWDFFFFVWQNLTGKFDKIIDDKKFS